ncbi:Outer membrane cobalamin receptor protein, SusC/RagA family [Bacteroidales bacterium Barb7]|nr:Outer membrane cobalamin receptor protein, SusC/RagA family [Bacteroidales bacterium Barb7]
MFFIKLTVPHTAHIAEYLPSQLIKSTIRMKRLVFLAYVFFCASLSLSAAGNARIKGKIVDAVSNNPIDFADIFLFAEGNSQPVANILPDAKGVFAFTDVKDGKYTLLIRLVGYDVFTRSEIVLAPASPALDLGVVAMKPLEVGLGEVEVVAQKRQVIYKLDKKVVEASSNLLAGGGSAVDILENTPSIRVDAEGEVSFRGSSGFAVYVDGKPSVFGGTQALQQIPSGHIENIEIITTPSARHDTEGDVGIINIITKKDAQQGFSGMVNLSGSTLLSRSGDFLLTKQNNRSRWLFGGSWTDRILKSDFDQEKSTTVNGIVTNSHSKGPRESNNFTYSLKGGWQYVLPRTTFTADVEGGYGGRLRTGDLDYSEQSISIYSSSFAPEPEYYFSRDYYHINETYYLGTVGADHKFNDKGHQITGSFYLKYGGDALEYFQSDLFDSDVDRDRMNNPTKVYKEAVKNYYKGRSPQHDTYEDDYRQMGHRAYEDEHRWTVRGNVDYIFPYSTTGRLEAGYQYYSYLEDGVYSMEFWKPEEKKFVFRTDDKIFDNFFYFQNGINSVYALVSDAYKSFNYQIGLRGEHTHRVLRSDVSASDRTYNNFHLFPSVHLGYNFPREQQLLVSYSRRITRPQLFYMEPYITYRDFYSAEIGNPDIRNEFINSFELNYKKNIGNHSVSATAFHRSRADKIERLRIPYESAIRAGVTLDSMANVGNDYSTGLELNTQVQAARWWNISLNGSLYYYRVVNKMLKNDKDETSTNYDITLNNAFDAGKYTRIQLDGNFVGPSVTTQGQTDAFWYVNLAVRQQMLARKLSATLAFRDVFGSARYVSTITTPDLRSVTHIRPAYPMITLSLTYTFNNYSLKASQSKDQRDIFEGTNH